MCPLKLFMWRILWTHHRWRIHFPDKFFRKVILKTFHWMFFFFGQDNELETQSKVMFVSSELDGCDRVRARHFFGFQGRQWVCPLKWLSCVTRYFQETRENVESSYKLAQLGNEKLEDQESFFCPEKSKPFSMHQISTVHGEQCKFRSQ